METVINLFNGFKKNLKCRTANNIGDILYSIGVTFDNSLLIAMLIKQKLGISEEEVETIEMKVGI